MDAEVAVAVRLQRPSDESAHQHVIRVVITSHVVEQPPEAVALRVAAHARAAGLERLDEAAERQAGVRLLRFIWRVLPPLLRRLLLLCDRLPPPLKSDLADLLVDRPVDAAAVRYVTGPQGSLG